MSTSSIPFRFLVGESEPPEAREKRRRSVGRSSGETYVDMLVRLAPSARRDRIKPVDADGGLPPGAGFADYDAVSLSGSPLSLYEELRLATVAAGGTVRPNRHGPEAAFARRITPTEAGRGHPMLSGRPEAYDAPSIHTDEVEALPHGAVLLASNWGTRVQAAEIRHDGGVCWGVQCHPEIGLDEVAGALRRQAGDLVEGGSARAPEDVLAHAELIEERHREPGRRELTWRLGLDEQVIDDWRTTELRNFVAALRSPAPSAFEGREPFDGIGGRTGTRA